VTEANASEDGVAEPLDALRTATAGLLLNIEHELNRLSQNRADQTPGPVEELKSIVDDIRVALSDLPR
jgi:hypothetical protein